MNELTGLPSNCLIGYYALERDKFSAKTISINNFSSGLTLGACMRDEGCLLLTLRGNKFVFFSYKLT